MDLARSSSSSGDGTLIPGLPEDIAALIMASLPYSHRCRLRPTSRSWNAFLSSASIASLRRLHRLPPCQILCLFPSDPSVVPPFLFDPVAIAWAMLPPLPCSPSQYGLSNFAALALGPHLYVLGGSHFDSCTSPIGQSFPSAAGHRLDLSVSLAPHLLSWTRIPDMLSPRGSFACTPIPRANSIIVAGGGSHHAMFPSSGTSISSAEIFNADSSEWSPTNVLPRYRSGCVGFFLPQSQRKFKKEQEVEDDEFWVMGGYGDFRPVAGIVPANVYYKDVLVLGLRSDKWREVGDMWEAGERQKLGQVVVMDDADGELLGVFMLDRDVIFRYDFASNHWCKESSLMHKVMSEEDSCTFVAMNGELCVIKKTMLFINTTDPAMTFKNRITIEIQAYNPHRKKWRFFTTNSPFPHTMNFKTAVSCTIQL